MKTLTRTLAAAAFALVAAGPATAAVSDAITVYDQPQQQDGFFQQQRGVLPDVSATGSIGAPTGAPAYEAPASSGTPFWAAHEAVRLNAQDHN